MQTRKSSTAAARLSFAAAGATILLLASLHLLSPEFDPSFRVVSEYANGRYGWVLSLMFLAWAISSWALAFAIRQMVPSVAGKIGLVFLILAGIGEAMASVFDIKHPLHGVAGALGVADLPIAAMLITVSLLRIPSWRPSRPLLLWTANSTWVILVLLNVAFILIRKVNVIGYPNRLLVVLYCVWVMVVAWQATRHVGIPGNSNE